MSHRLFTIAAVLAAIGAAAWYLMVPQTAPTAGGPIVDVTVPALDAMAQKGEQAFNRNCAACHGKNAAGQEGVAPPLVHKIYEPGHHGDMSFVLAAKQGVRQHHWSFGNMPPVPTISDPEIVEVIAYVRTLQRANGIE